MPFNYGEYFDNMTQEEKDKMLEEVGRQVEEDMKNFLAEHFPPDWRKKLKFVKMTIVPEDYWHGWIFGRHFAWRD